MSSLLLRKSFISLPSVLIHPYCYLLPILFPVFLFYIIYFYFFCVLLLRECVSISYIFSLFPFSFHLISCIFFFISIWSISFLSLGKFAYPSHLCHYPSLFQLFMSLFVPISTIFFPFYVFHFNINIIFIPSFSSSISTFISTFLHHISTQLLLISLFPLSSHA